MNRTEIEWVKNADGTQGYTWNPWTGCLHGCPYCYARRIAKRFGKTAEERAFEPIFHPERLDEPARLKKSSTIFVCSMADLFGAWVYKKDIERVIRACNKAPRHLYIFLTKNPGRYYLGRGFKWPPKYMRGATRTNGITESVGGLIEQTFVSIEPLLGPVTFHDEWGWVIIGAMTGPGATKPKLEWIKDIVEWCKDYKVPVFMKNSLKDIWPRELIQEMPWVHK